eukprot:TRINITY_DN8135_c0_g1_i2.p2 TRINITY_DN8135_c0_g1~~TRINITY_DN8135_c0_g1_i2.p2  ORF type:complete len:135 (-),score=8.19 TRINITY_DN8135_c0_g1_i2:389-793(-)
MDRRYTLAIVALVVGSLAHEFPYCYPGQIAGVGFVSFDHCSSSSGSFVCKVTSNCSLTQCGGPSHGACKCGGCELQTVLSQEVLPLNGNYSCGCDAAPDFGCYCDPYPLYACQNNKCVPAEVGGTLQQCTSVCV